MDTEETKEKDKKIKVLKKTGLVLKFFKPYERLLIVGKTQLGKTFLARKLMKYYAREYLIVVLDVKKEYKDLKEITPKLLLNPLATGVYKLTSLNYIKYQVVKPKPLAEFLADNLFKRGNCILVLEEVASYIKNKGDLYTIAPKVARYLQQGQIRNCGMILISQRPAEVHTNFRSQCQHIIAFFMKLDHDREAFKHYFPPELFDRLTDYEFLRYSDPHNVFIHYKLY